MKYKKCCLYNYNDARQTHMMLDCVDLLICIFECLFWARSVSLWWNILENFSLNFSRIWCYWGMTEYKWTIILLCMLKGLYFKRQSVLLLFYYTIFSVSYWRCYRLWKISDTSCSPHWTKLNYHKTSRMPWTTWLPPWTWWRLTSKLLFSMYPFLQWENFKVASHEALLYIPYS